MAIGASDYIQIQNFDSKELCQEWTNIILQNEQNWIERDNGAWPYGNAMNSNQMFKLLPNYPETMLNLTPNDQICLETREHVTKT